MRSPKFGCQQTSMEYVGEDKRKKKIFGLQPDCVYQTTVTPTMKALAV
jgi:hypothetical protein